MANKYDENYVKTSEAAYEKQKEINQPKTAENNINRQEIAGKKPDSSTGFSCSIIAYSQSTYFILTKTEAGIITYIVDKETNMRYIKTEVIVDKETIFAAKGVDV